MFRPLIRGIGECSVLGKPMKIKQGNEQNIIEITIYSVARVLGMPLCNSWISNAGMYFREN